MQFELTIFALIDQENGGRKYVMLFKGSQDFLHIINGVSKMPSPLCFNEKDREKLQDFVRADFVLRKCNLNSFPPHYLQLKYEVAKMRGRYSLWVLNGII